MKRTTNAKKEKSGAINAGLSKNSDTTTNGRNFTAKSTATAAQYHRIVKMLRTGEKSTLDFRRAGVMAPAARIKELNEKHGFYIPTVAQRDLYDQEGYCHPRVAIYELIDEPNHGKRA